MVEATQIDRRLDDRWLWTARLSDVDPTVSALIEREFMRQEAGIELVASENFTWLSALSALATPCANKLADGYPGRRDTGGCEVIDEIETEAVDRAKRLFGADHANVQPHSGAQANMAVYAAYLEPGDTILAMRPEHGGHHTHGLKSNFSGRLYRFLGYGLDPTTGLIDFAEVHRLAKQYRPKLVVCGASAYPRRIDTERFREIAADVGAFLLCDMAHIAGLVAAGIHPNPVPHADFVTSTIHKTLAGPRCGGFVLCSAKHIAAIDRAVYPGSQSAPFPQAIAAKAVSLRIAASQGFRSYQERVVSNATALAETLCDGGLALLSGGTDTHLMLVDVRSAGLTARDAARALAQVHITVNEYAYPGGGPDSGLRLGTPAVTMRGMGATEAREVGNIVLGALSNSPDVPGLQHQVAALCEKYPLYAGSDGLPWEW